MKRFNVLLLIIAFTGILAQAQNKSELFFTGLAERSASVKSFSGDFLQKKKIRLTDREMISKGTVRYDKGSAIRFDYLSPRKMSVVVGKNDLKIITPEKTTTYDLSAQKELSALVAVMNDCLAGNVKGLSKNCKVEYMEENSAHVVNLYPLPGNTSYPYESIVLLFDTTDYSIKEIVLNERSKDITSYQFLNLKLHE